MTHDRSGLARDYFRATERALYEYPSLKAQLRQREQWIEALCAGGGATDVIPAGPISTRPAVTVQERTVIKKESDHTCILLRAKTEAVAQAYNSMGEQLRDLVCLRYWRGLSQGEIMAELAVSEREYYRRRRRAVEQVAPYVVGPFGM